MGEKERRLEGENRDRQNEDEDDVQGHRFSEDLTGDDVSGHVQTSDDEEDVAGHVTPPQARPGTQP